MPHCRGDDTAQPRGEQSQTTVQLAVLHPPTPLEHPAYRLIEHKVMLMSQVD